MLCSDLMCSSKLTVLLSNADRLRPKYVYDAVELSRILKEVLIIQPNTTLTAHKTSVLEDQLLLLLFTPQIRKRIDNHTKDQIQHDNDDDKEEQQIVDDSRHK